eukprot:CAMPEP_0198368680 /NCGR_PEP_ID=MMETSP1450-20131203/155823_1 /TAXON_ID=753684 ORGANISM="Madagascaria erythrocladiodes, Strain CCMP3234" /NCGR_SAMPLE_ID=MMETSP1450 /ASSEMBLY_ACC=CAM_ASM_001115 /LENGTH=285 /DNA_ID=CAMNT_0044076189 /DNA_START=106 /DNA_END=963 /DNA_ORIENTATION=-
MEFTLDAADPSFGYIENLPVVSSEFEGSLRWHVDKNDLKAASGALYSFDTGRVEFRTGRAEFNVVARLANTHVLVFHLKREFATTDAMMMHVLALTANTHVLVFHLKREFATADAMMMHVLALTRVSDQFGARLRVLCVRGASSPFEAPGSAQIQKIAANFGYIAMRDIGFVSSSGRFIERALVRTILFFVKKTSNFVDFSFLEEPNGPKLWVENGTPCNTRVPTRRELTQAREKFRVVLTRWMEARGQAEDISFLEANPSGSLPSSFDCNTSRRLEQVIETSLE